MRSQVLSIDQERKKDAGTMSKSSSLTIERGKKAEVNGMFIAYR